MPSEPKPPDPEEELNQAVTADTKRILSGAAPERSEKLDQIWNKYQPEVRVLSDREGFNFGAGPHGKIYIGPRDGELIWLYAFMSCRRCMPSQVFCLSRLLMVARSASAA